MDKLSKFESLSDANLSTIVGGSDKNNVFFQIERDMLHRFCTGLVKVQKELRGNRYE